MIKKKISLAVAIVLCASLFGASRCPASVAVVPPDMPFWANDNIAIDSTLLNTIAEKYQAQFGAAGSARDFFLRYLLLASVDDLATLPLSRQAVKAYLGNFYIAGYFGGIILRDAVFIYGGASKDDFLGVIMGAMPPVLQTVMGLGADNLIFGAVAGLAGNSVKTSFTGWSSSVIAANRLSVELLLAVYGIDTGLYGYFQSIPPVGASAADNGLSCSSFLGCSMQNATVEALSRYSSALWKANNPQPWKFWSPSAMRWCEMHASTNTIGKASASLVGFLFKNVLGTIAVPAEEYVPLVELTATSVIVAESALLHTMQGYAEMDAAAGRKGLLLEAGKIMWLGSFMLGMSSDLPQGTFPELN